jgi:hypothetical protein
MGFLTVSCFLAPRDLLSCGSFDEEDPAIFSSWFRSTIRSMRTACQLVHDLSKRRASGQAFPPCRHNGVARLIGLMR